MLDYLLKKFPEAYPTQEALAARLGKTQGWVSQHLRVLELAKDNNITRVIKPEQLTERHARAILSAPEEKRKEIAEDIAKHIEETGKAPSARDIQKATKPKPTEYDIAEFECSHCGFKAIIVHVEPDKHKFVKVTKA